MFNETKNAYEIKILDPFDIQNPDRHVFDMTWYDNTTLILLERSHQSQNVILQRYDVSEQGIAENGNLLNSYPLGGICNRIAKSMYFSRNYSRHYSLGGNSLFLCCEGTLVRLNMETAQISNIRMPENALVTAVVEEATSLMIANEQGGIYSIPFDRDVLYPISRERKFTCCALASDSTHLYVFNQSCQR